MGGNLKPHLLSHRTAAASRRAHAGRPTPQRARNTVTANRQRAQQASSSTVADELRKYTTTHRPANEFCLCSETMIVHTFVHDTRRKPCELPLRPLKSEVSIALHQTLIPSQSQRQG